MTTNLPLLGLTVTEIGHNVAAPFAGSILAQLGASVLKVETPRGGDPTRDWGPPYRAGTAVIFDALNRDKRAVTVDLKEADAVAALRRRILDDTDVVIQNLRPGSIDRQGLGALALTSAKPSLVYCNLGAFGHRGPLRDKPGFDPLMQAYCGLMSVTGEENGAPVRVGASIIDMGAGMWAVIAILAALRERDRTGRGGVVDTSLFETALAWLTIPVGTFLASGNVPGRLGTAAPQIVPYQAFATLDGHLMVAAGNDGLFRRFAEVLRKPQWPVDERFASNGARVVNRRHLVPEIALIMQTRTTADWTAALDAAGVPCAGLQSLDAVAHDPQTLALGMIQSDETGTPRYIGLPVSFDGARPQLRAVSPKLGEHNDDLAYEARP